MQGVALLGGDLLSELALVTAVAALATLVCHTLRQPVVLGYLLAGIVVGPHGPLGDLADPQAVRALADLGIVFLMFSIGLEFRLRRLTRAGSAALGAAVLGVVAVALASFLGARALGWSQGDALFLAASLAISSTVIAAKAILEARAQGSRWADFAMAILIAQDVLAVAILAVLGGTGGATAAHGLQAVSVLGILGVLGRLATFAIAALIGGLLVVPRLVNRLARTRADEVLVVALAALALGTALLAVRLGFSPALGAFLMGAVVAEASEAYAAEQRVLPLRDLFTAVFFVSIGMLLDPATFGATWLPAVLLGLLMVALKIGVHTGAGIGLGAPPRQAFQASLAVAQIGEFSFVIAGLGLALGAASPSVLSATVAIAIGTALATPYFVRHGDTLFQSLARRVPPSSRARLAGLEQRRAARRAARRAQPRLSPDARHHIGQALSNSAAVLLILLATSELSGVFLQWFTVRGLSDRALVLLPWLAGGVLALPFAFNAARAAQALLAPAGTLSKRRGYALLLLSSLAISFAFLVLAPFAASSLPPLPLVLLGLAAFLGASVVMWESVAILHKQVGQTVERALGGAAQGEQQRAVLDTLRREYRLGSDVESTRVQHGTAASGTTVRGLDLRARTGATLLAVQRGGHTLVNPPADLVLQPGDALVLLGLEDQLERAKAALLLPAGELFDDAEEPDLARLELQAGSPLASRSVGEGKLRDRAGVTVVGILRGGVSMPNPSPDVVLEPGDTLLVLGSPAQLRAAEALAKPLSEEASESAAGTVPPATAEGPNP